MTNKHKAFVSKELETLTQELNKEIKILENTLQEKYVTKKSLIKLNKEIQDSISQLSQVVEELLSSSPDQIQVLRMDAMNLFQIDFNLPDEKDNSSYGEEEKNIMPVEENIFVLFQQLTKQYKNYAEPIRNEAYKYLDWLELQCQKEIRFGKSISDVSRRHFHRLESMLKGGEIPSIPPSRPLSKETLEIISYQQNLADYRNKRSG